MRPANGSAIVFHTKAESGPFSSAARVTFAPCLSRPVNGRSAGAGRYATIASSSWGMPTFSSADEQTSGKSLPAIAALRSPDTSSASVSVPASKKCSMSFSSFSATISMSASRAASTSALMSAGTAPSVNAPPPSFLKTNARFVTRSTTPRKSFSSPIGS